MAESSITTTALCLFPISLYPEITSDTQRHEYKKEFDSDLRTYKELCAEMDDINDQINKLSRELDTLEEGTSKYEVSDWNMSWWILHLPVVQIHMTFLFYLILQAVAEEYNRLKDVKRVSHDYKTKEWLNIWLMFIVIDALIFC